jgi:predicted MPP superfamily phosphohydrolase
MQKRKKLSRRDFLKAGLLAVTGLCVTPTAITLAVNEVYRPVVKRTQVHINGLPQAFQGFRIVALSDFHLYPYICLSLVRQVVEMANDLHPDLVVLLGDYVWHEVDAIFDLAPLLAGLDARHGMFAVIGNHDIWTDRQVVEQGLRQSAIPLLINQGVTLSQDGQSLNLVGLDDGWSGQPDITSALDNLPGNLPTILLLHEPDLADQVVQQVHFDLQLSGHSHGGQVRWDGQAKVLPHLGRKYDLGLFQVGDMAVYTSAGIGVISVPLRLNCPPEVTEITLV